MERVNRSVFISQDSCSTALKRLKEKLLVIAQEQRVNEIREIRGDLVAAAWGEQVRNYVLHPYRLVKDLRTGYETSQVSSNARTTIIVKHLHSRNINC